MSEATMEGQIKLSARDKAIQYIQEKDAKRGERIRLGGPPRIAPQEVEIAAATAYEKVIGRLGDNGVRRVLEEMRPVAYDAARIYRLGAKYADGFVTGALLFNPNMIPALGRRLNRVPSLGSRALIRGAGVVGMMKFRPIEYAATTAVKVGGVVASEYAGLANKITDRILGVKQPEKAKA